MYYEKGWSKKKFEKDLFFVDIFSATERKKQDPDP